MLSISHATMQNFEYIRSVGHWPPSPAAEKEIESKIRDKRCYILREGDSIVGIMRFIMMFEFIPFLTLIWIEEPYQGKGYGKQAMTYWENEMRVVGYKMIMVSTQVDEGSQHFYRKLGYKDMGTIVMDIPPYEQPLEMFMGKAL
jgi:GNAT superfamily N-acetyltransferase